MGIRLRILFIKMVLLLSCASMFGQGETPPPPNRMGAPPPFGLPMPIDEHIYILVFLGVILGFYFIYKKKKQVLS